MTFGSAVDHETSPGRPPKHRSPLMLRVGIMPGAAVDAELDRLGIKITLHNRMTHAKLLNDTHDPFPCTSHKLSRTRGRDLRDYPRETKVALANGTYINTPWVANTLETLRVIDGTWILTGQRVASKWKPRTLEGRILAPESDVVKGPILEVDMANPERSLSISRVDHGEGKVHTKDNTVLMLSRLNLAQQKLPIEIFRQQTQAVARVRDSGAREEEVRGAADAMARFTGGTREGMMARAKDAVDAAMG